METNERSSTTLAPIDAGTIIAAANASGSSLSVPMPFQNKIVLIEQARIAGTTHIYNIDAIVQKLKRGDALQLERDTQNVVDAWAIKVYAHTEHIGYVPADCNEVLARLMDGGKALSATLTSKEKVGTWNKLHMEVSLDD